jgi:pimeloyl-ACP methyl ester carboxylesterase
MRARLVSMAAIGGAAIVALASMPVTPAPVPPQAAGPEKFVVASDGHPLTVWARRPAAAPRASVLLVHGRTWSSRPDFDLQVPGLRRSVMQALAAQGFAAYAVDLRGYGDTPRDKTGWLTPRRTATDIVNVLAWVSGQHPGLPQPALVGWSRGAAVSMLAAESAPARLSALVVFGFAYDPDLTFTDAALPDRPLMQKNTRQDAAADFISPRVTPPAVVDAFVATALRTDPVLMDLKNDTELNGIHPARLTMPTLVIYGERDPGVAPADAAKLFARLGASDKALVQLAGGDHAAQLEDTHDAWMAAVVSFLTRPPARR